MLDQDKILNFLKVNGPVLPSKVAKNIKTDILLASAMLSDLASQGKVRISKLKIGGSPLYYLPGQEDQLYNFALGNINPKDHHVLDKLKFNKILREKDLDLLGKVALRSLKDFAVPLHVTVQGNKELFWKWHLLSDEETTSMIRFMLYGSEKEQKAEPQQEAKPETRREPEDDKASSAQKVLVEKSSQQEAQKEEKQKDEGKTLAKVQKPAEKKTTRKKISTQDDFILILEKYFNDHQVSVEEKEVVRKNSEVDMLVKVPSVVGDVTYFCKSKNKSRCDEKDLSSAYMEAQIKKLPLLFLYKKEMTKKAREMLDSGAFQNVIIKRFE